MNSLIKKVVVVLLTGVLLFTVVCAAPDDQSNNQPQNSDDQNKTEQKEELTQTQKDGIQFGTIDGALAGKKDYVNGQKSDYLKAMLKGEEIVERYDLRTYSELDIAEFVNAYRKAFKDSYRMAMSEQLLEQYFSPATRGEKSGTELGTAEGIAMANIDLLNNTKSDWLLAYNSFISNGDLTKRYQLELQENSYYEAFIIAFKASFKKSYREHYDAYKLAQTLRNTTYHLVRYDEDSVIYDKTISQVDSGAEASSSNSTAELLIDRGTVYQDTYLSLQCNKNVTLIKNGKYDAASGVYQISIQNDRDGIKLYKPLKLRFVYTDNPNIGVYQWVYNHWQYIETKHDEAGVSIEIPAGVYCGGKYALFIDDDFITPHDSVYSWAYRDIVLALKRNYFVNSTTFRPDHSMTRYEMADLIYQVMRYRNKLVNHNFDIIDRASFKQNPLPVEYVLTYGFMKLDENRAFNSSQYVSYEEFADIMRRLTKDATFDYGLVASKMFYEHYTMSGYLNDKNGNPTRAEVIFTFNEYIR